MSSSYRVAVAGVSSLTIAAQSQHGSDCTRVAVVNGLPLVLQAMNAHASHPAVVRECLKALEVMLLATNSCGDVINELAGESSLPQVGDDHDSSPSVAHGNIMRSSICDDNCISTLFGESSFAGSKSVTPNRENWCSAFKFGPNNPHIAKLCKPLGRLIWCKWQ